MVAGRFKVKTYASFQLLLKIAPFSPTVEEQFQRCRSRLSTPTYSSLYRTFNPVFTCDSFTVHLIQLSRVIPLLYIFTCDLNE